MGYSNYLKLDTYWLVCMLLFIKSKHMHFYLASFVWLPRQKHIFQCSKTSLSVYVFNPWDPWDDCISTYNEWLMFMVN